MWQLHCKLILTKFTVFSHLTLFFQIFTSPKVGTVSADQPVANLWYLIMMGVLFALISVLLLIYMLYLLVAKKGDSLNQRIESSLKFSLDFAIPCVALLGTHHVLNKGYQTVTSASVRFPVPVTLLISVILMMILNLIFFKGKVELAK